MHQKLFGFGEGQEDKEEQTLKAQTPKAKWVCPQMVSPALDPTCDGDNICIPQPNNITSNTYSKLEAVNILFATTVKKSWLGGKTMDKMIASGYALTSKRYFGSY